MFPPACAKASTTGKVTIYKNGVSYLTFNVKDGFGTPYSYKRNTWPVGNYTALVKITWTAIDVKDFTFRTYFPVGFTIKYTSYAADTDATTAATTVSTFTIPSGNTGSIQFAAQMPDTPLINSIVQVPAPAWPKSYPAGATADLTKYISQQSSFAVSDYTAFKLQKGWASLTNGDWGYFVRLTPPASGSTTISFTLYGYGTSATISFTNGFSACYQNAATTNSQTMFTCTCKVSATLANSCDAMMDIVGATSAGWSVSYSQP